MTEPASFPHDIIQTSDVESDRAIWRLRHQSTWDEASAVKRLVKATRARQLAIGMRSTPDAHPEMTIVVRSGADAYIADNGSLNLRSAEREREVRDMLQEVIALECSVAVFSHLVPHTDSLRPNEAEKLLSDQDVVPVGSADDAITALKKLVGL